MTRLTRRQLLKTAALAGGAAGLGAPRGRVAALARAQTPREAFTVAGRPVEIAITPATPLTVRISVLPIADGSPHATPSDGALVERAWPAAVARVTSARSEPIRAGDLVVRIGGAEPQIDVSVNDGRLLQRVRIDPVSGAMAFRLGDGPILGLGEGGPQFDRRGSADRMRSGQGGYELRTHGGRVPIPWLVGTSGWAMFVHQPEGAFDFTGVDGRFVPRDPAAALPLDIFIVGAREPSLMLAEYAKLTGYPEMPPLWSFGYQQSHRTLTSRQEILDEAKTFREKKLPCDTMIYLGAGFCPSGWNTDNGEFTFNSKVFPDPPEVIRELHADHFKVVLHAVLEGHTLTGTVGEPCTAAPLPSGKTPDGRWPPDRQVSCYWPVHEAVVNTGIDGWWPDQGDGLDGPSRLARIRMYWDGSRALRPNERPFALHRNGYPGMQRYAAFLWSGDVYSTWETLKTHIPVAVNAALSGIPFWGTDIGGFVPTKELTGELYVRWFQFGAFCPLFRAHGRTWKLRLPWGWNTGELGPDEVANYTGGASNPDPGELHNALVEPICRKFLDLRYRLLPYLYSNVHVAHLTGLPPIRALWLHYPDDKDAVARGDVFLWGRDMLVAPVVEKAATARTLYLPRGRWFDFWTEESVEGGREVSRPVDFSTMPLLVRAGAMLPLGPVRQSVDDSVDGPTEIRVFPGSDGTFTLYEDDGRSFGYQGGEWLGIDLEWNDRQRRLTLRPAEGSRPLDTVVSGFSRTLSERRFEIRVAGSRASHKLVYKGRPISITI